MVVVLLLLMVPVWYRYGPRAVYTHIQAVTKINIKLGTGTYPRAPSRILHVIQSSSLPGAGHPKLRWGTLG